MSRAEPSPARFPLPILVLMAAWAAAAPAQPPSFCSINAGYNDFSSTYCSSASSYEKFGGNACEPMVIAAAWIEKGPAMIPTGYCGVSVGEIGKAHDTVHRIVARGKLPDSFKDDCIPWKLNTRYRTALGRGVGGGLAASAQVQLVMPNGTYTVTAPPGGLNAHTDTTFGGCVPLGQVLAKEATGLTRLSAFIQLSVTNANQVGDSYEAEIVVDPYLTIDPAWPSAALFKVEQQASTGEWFEIDRDWLQGVPWVDATAGLLAQAGNDASASWGDYDGDGRLDVCVMNYAQTNQLLHNDGDGAFSDATPAALLFDAAGAAFARWADFDGDGDLDLYAINGAGASGSSNTLLRNDGAGSFTNVTTPLWAHPGYNMDAAWADYDRDGDLDAYLVSCFSGNHLLRNDGGGSFSDATPPALQDTGCGRSAAWGDYDGDGWPDLYLARSDTPNRLLRNLGGGAFADVTATAGPVGDAGSSQSAAWGDYDNDGRLDLYVSNFGANRLLHNEGGGAFADSTGARTASASNTLTAAWADFDLDGNLDLYVQNSVQRNDLLVAMGNHEFDWALWHTTGPIEQPGNGGLSVLDVDDDGDVDVYLARSGPNALLRNDQSLGRHWLAVDLRGSGAPGGSNRFGVGARVRVVSPDGQSRVREVSASPGRWGGAPLRLHFGLGDQARVDTLEVRWPSGAITRSAIPFTADRLVTAHESGLISGIWDAPEAPPRPVLHQNRPNPFNPVTFIRYELAAPAQVRLAIHDATGRRVRTLVNGRDQLSGRHEAIWDGRDDAGRPCASGVYLYRLEAGAFAESGKMALLR